MLGLFMLIGIVFVSMYAYRKLFPCTCPWIGL